MTSQLKNTSNAQNFLILIAKKKNFIITGSPSKDHRDTKRNYMLHIAIFHGIVARNDIKGGNNNDNCSKN